jgi:hypothetical protein
MNFILTRSSDKNKFVYFNYISYLFEALEPHLMELDLSELKLNFNQFNLTQFIEFTEVNNLAAMVTKENKQSKPTV